jgi:hypothetical protein
MITRVSCGHCHRLNLLPAHGGPAYCPDCGHQVGVSRLACGCPRCRPPLVRLGPPPSTSRYCDKCGKNVESHAWRQYEEDETCLQMCHRHFQE